MSSFSLSFFLNFVESVFPIVFGSQFQVPPILLLTQLFSFHLILIGEKIRLVFYNLLFPSITGF